MELPARYGRALDDRDIPALLEVFCADGTFGRADGSHSFTGRAELERFYTGVLLEYSLSLHIPRAQVIERIEGDEASGWVVAHAELATADGYIVTAIRYEDAYRREDGRWRIASRHVWFWYITGFTDLAETVVSADRKRFRGPNRPADLPEGLDTYQRFVAAGPQT